MCSHVNQDLNIVDSESTLVNMKPLWSFAACVFACVSQSDNNNPATEDR